MMPALLIPYLAKYSIHLAVAAGLVVGYFMWERKIENRGVMKERARVEQTGKKLAKKAGAAAATAERDPRGVLRTWQRD